MGGDKVVLLKITNQKAKKLGQDVFLLIVPPQHGEPQAEPKGGQRETVICQLLPVLVKSICPLITLQKSVKCTLSLDLLSSP